MCLIQCGGLWFINGKVSIVWNLKQAVVQKPRETIEGTCFLKPKASDVETLKSQAPPADEIHLESAAAAVASNCVIVEDSDGEEDMDEPAPAVAVAAPPAPEPVAVAAPAVAVAVAVAVAAEPAAEPVKKKIVRKKTEA